MHCCTKIDGKELDLSKTYSKLLTNLSYVAVTFMPYLLGAHTSQKNSENHIQNILAAAHQPCCFFPEYFLYSINM